jgi:hypothetical protein
MKNGFSVELSFSADHLVCTGFYQDDVMEGKLLCAARLKLLSLPTFNNADVACAGVGAEGFGGLVFF